MLGQELSAAQLVEMMGHAEVDRVMLCAWHRPGKWVISNETIAAFVQQFPQRFVRVAAVNLEKPVESEKFFPKKHATLLLHARRMKQTHDPHVAPMARTAAKVI